MSAWNRFLGKVRRGADIVADKVEEWGDRAAASVRAKSLEISIDEKYEDLGRIVYRALNTEEDLEAEKQEILDKLDELIAELDAIKTAKAERKTAQGEAEDEAGESAEDEGTCDKCDGCDEKECAEAPAKAPADEEKDRPEQ